MKSFFRVLRDLVEIYIPSASFLIMFVAFVAQVLFRYVFRTPITWSSELIAICFVWSVTLGACYAMRTRSHVTFTMIYDALSPRLAAAFRLTGDLAICAAFLLLFVPAMKYVGFLEFQKTAVLRIPMSAVFFPFLYFLLSIVGYTCGELREDLRTLFRSPRGASGKGGGGL